MKQLTRINRVIECFEVFGAIEHGSSSMLIYNNHQPKSKFRPFSVSQQIDLCKAALKYAIQFCAETEQCVGYGFGGNANCGMAIWSVAFQETPEHELSFTQPSFTFGLNKKSGDLMVGAGKEGLSFKENACAIKARGKQHDPMIMG